MAKIKYFTHQNPPVCGAEVFLLPTETRESDNMNLDETIARFFPNGPQKFISASDLSVEDRDKLFDDPEVELEEADISEQKAFINEVADKMKKVLPTQSKKTEPEKTKSAENDKTADEVLEK